VFGTALALAQLWFGSNYAVSWLLIHETGTSSVSLVQ
jgi:hypothetical protein